MKIKEVADVSYSLDKRRMAKQAQAGKEKRMQQDQAEADKFAAIDNAIAQTIDFLVNEHGMDQEDAHAAVIDHLGDLVAAHDMIGGM